MPHFELRHSCHKWAICCVDSPFLRWSEMF
jgi:hypothetical protein